MGFKSIIGDLRSIRRAYKEAKKTFKEKRTLSISNEFYSELHATVVRGQDQQCVSVESVHQTIYNRKIVIPANLIFDCWQGFLFLNSEERLAIFNKLIGWENPGERAERIREFGVVQQQLNE